MRLSTYVIQQDDSSSCPMCGRKLHLLCARNGSTRKPWFYICWLCTNVVQVGVGPVTEEVQLPRQKPAEPAPSFNQHPQYEAWKSICPNCRSHSTTHHNNAAAEFAVILRCLDCGFTFNLEHAFKAELQRQVSAAQKGETK